MAEKKSAARKQSMAGRQNYGGNALTIGDISGNSGELNVAGGNIIKRTVTTTGLNPAEIKRGFEQLYAVVDANAKASSADKEDMKAQLKEIEDKVVQAVQKKQPVEEGFLATHVRNILRMSPDIADVVLGGMSNPPFGAIAVAMKKITEKAKADPGAA